MDYVDQKIINALESIARELSLVNENLNKIANSAIAVIPDVKEEPEKQLIDNSLCGHVNDCESVVTLRKIIDDRNDTIDKLTEEKEFYRETLHDYEKKLKGWMKESKKPDLPLEKPYHKGMEVTTFGAK